MKCFVIMPFGNPQVDPDYARQLDQIYLKWIKPTIESIKVPGSSESIICHRADEEARPGEIIFHIIENLFLSEIVIADLSGRNANVYYELGVRHAINNNTILIADDINDIPFDLRSLRTITYKYDPEGMLRLKENLERAILKILNEPEKIDNPVRNYLYNREVLKLISQPTPPGYDVLKDVIKQLSSLKKEIKSHASQTRKVLKILTASKEISTSTEEPIDFKAFEGVWRDRQDGTTVCIRIVNEKILAPYSYGDMGGLTAHIYNFKILGRTILARFEWFKFPISGYITLSVNSSNHLSGSWWYDENMRIENMAELAETNLVMSEMYEISLERQDYSSFPTWAEEYFKSHSTTKITTP